MTCPYCGSKLKVNDSRKRSISLKEYFIVLDTCKGFQVIRMFFASFDCKKGKTPNVSCMEVCQRWISPEGKSVAMALLRRWSFCFVDVWNFYSDMEVRPMHRVYEMISNCLICPRKRISPQLKRNGFKRNFYKINSFDLFCAILTDSKMETLLKSGQVALLKHFINSSKKVNYFWDSIRICNRNGDIVKDASMWCDYIDMQKDFNRDTRNAHYECADKLKEKHDEFMKKTMQKRERRRLEEQKRKAEEDEKCYKDMKAKFFDLVFTDSTICLRVLQRVEEFVEEGKAMHHCVGSSSYYLKPNSLVFSATKDGQPIETVEVSLETLHVIQSRGVCNSQTEYHDQIIELINKNIGLVQKRMELKMRTLFTWGDTRCPM